MSLTADDEISREAREIAANLFDFIRDLLDVNDDVSYSDKLKLNDSLEAMLRELEGLGTAVYSAFRHVRITSKSWTDKTPLPLTVGY